MALAERSTEDVCRVCLTLSSKLSPLGEYSNLYYLLLGKKYDIADNDDDDTDVEAKSYLCCICRDMFKKIQEFQQKIWRTQNIILKKVKLEMQQCNETSDHKIYLDMKTEVSHNIDENPIETPIDIGAYLKEENDSGDGDPGDYDSEHIISDVEKNIQVRGRKKTNSYKIGIELVQQIKAQTRDRCLIIDTSFEETNLHTEVDGIKDITKKNKVTKNKAKRDKSNFKKVPVKEPLRGPCRGSYNVVSGRKLIKKKYIYFKLTKCDTKNVNELIKAARFNKFYRLGKFKCGKCIKAFKDEQLLQKHMEDQHSESAGTFTCEYCEVRTPTKKLLRSHIRRHYCQYSCSLCDHTCYCRWQMRSHFVEVHSTVFECRECGVVKCRRRDFYKHVKEMHKKFICDYCGKVCLYKHVLEKHIFKNHASNIFCKLCNKYFKNYSSSESHRRVYHKSDKTENTYCVECDRHFENWELFRKHVNDSVRHGTARKKKSYNHTPIYSCKPCNKKFSTFRSYFLHNKLHHVYNISENTYCVECDRQFENRDKLRNHLRDSVKHGTARKKKSATCLECGKVYNCKGNMMNHYRLVHLKVTNYQCNVCSRYFLNSYRLKQHVKTVHDRIAPTKDKICTYCGRGFSTKVILANHIRTHTGERPHACPHCSAAFAQPYALQTHIRARHKDLT